jgi:GT2 family glycosyltransferase
MQRVTKPAGSSSPTGDEMTHEAGGSGPDVSVTTGPSCPEAPTTSVCILVLDTTDLARRCLESLRRPGGCPPSTELVIMANGTSARQLERLGSLDDAVVIKSMVNLGFAGGCNQAAKVAKGRFLVFVNDDSEVAPGCIEALVAAATSDPAIGAVGSRILSSDGSLQEAGSVLWGDGWSTHIGEGVPSSSDTYLEPRDVDYASANGLLVTRRAWDAVGGFDERYFPAYFEDVDLCLSLAASGFAIRYEPRARLVHLGSQSTTEPFRQFLLTRNRQQLVDKWGQTLARFPPRPNETSGRRFVAAVNRAIIDSSRRSVAPVPGGLPVGAIQPVSRDQIDREYRQYLESELIRAEDRIRALRAYVSGLWSVRLKACVARVVSPRPSRPPKASP